MRVAQPGRSSAPATAASGPARPGARACQAPSGPRSRRSTEPARPRARDPRSPSRTRRRFWRVASSLASVSARCCLYRVIPAASSDEHPPVERLRGEDVGQPLLLHERVGLRVHAGAEEEIVDVLQPAHGLVEEVLGLPVAIQAPSEADLAPRDGDLAVVREREEDLGTGRAAGARSTRGRSRPPCGGRGGPWGSARREPSGGRRRCSTSRSRWGRRWR